MIGYRETTMGWFLKALIFVNLVLLAVPMALSGAPSILGSEIPLMEGARIIKEKQFQGSGRFEVEVENSPEKVVEFYHAAMQARGWPAGRIISSGSSCGLMLMHQGNMFTAKAVAKDGRTYVTLAVVLKSSFEKALDSQTSQRHHNAAKPVAAPKEKTLPANSNVTIEGAPIGKGDLIHRHRLPGSNDSGIEKKDDGNLPDDPSPSPADDDPDPDDSWSDDSSQPEDALDAVNGFPERISVSIHALVRWTVTNPDEDEYTGTVNLHVNGNMKIVEAGSPTVPGAQGAFRPVLTYRPENGTVSFVYEDRKTTLKRIPSGKCQNPLIVEYHGSGMMPLSEESSFKVHRYSASAAPYLQNLSADKQRFLSAFKGSMALPDHYELMVGPGGDRKRIRGRKKDAEKTECAYIPVDRSFPGCRIGIQVELPASGALAGSRAWSADDQGLCPPSLGISILDIAATQTQKPLKPPAGGNRNVTYKVSWQIRKAEAYTPVPAESKEKKKPCQILKDRINTIRIIRKLFQNQKLKQYCREKFGTQDYKAYCQMVEKTAQYIFNQEFETYLEASDFIDNLDPNAIQTIASSDVGGPETLMMADAAFDKESGELKEMKILGYVDGKPYPVMEFPNLEYRSARKTGNYKKVKQAYGRKYFESGVGEIMFESQIAHEKTMPVNI